MAKAENVQWLAIFVAHYHKLNEVSLNLILIKNKCLELNVPLLVGLQCTYVHATSMASMN